MPLLKGKSKAVIGRNIGTLLAEGRPFNQARAIALRTAGVPKSHAKHFRHHKGRRSGFRRSARTGRFV